VYNIKGWAWEKIASGLAGYTPSRFCLCGRKGDKDNLPDIIIKLRFLGIDISIMSYSPTEWEDVYIRGNLIPGQHRASWINTPIETYGELD
jgi:hypothetical protein